MNEQLTEESRSAKRREFDELTAAARERRKKIDEIFRTLCVELGNYWTAVTRVSELRHELREFFNAGSDYGRVGLRSPDDLVVNELLTPWDPLPTALDSGLKPIMHLGWSHSVTAAPLVPKFKTQLSEEK